MYLLLDKNVYSSNEMWANFAKQTGWATLVGEKTGGNGIGWEGALAALPNSGFLVRIQLMMGLTEDGFCDDE
ncbi:S41 family peptidase [Paenibacillus selenitireducens]|uniref:S41 family peptidase n=1 Tax=Paenibacillus selenitireducens TaxID=1324314 RepID=UPI0038CD1CD5